MTGKMNIHNEMNVMNYFHKTTKIVFHNIQIGPQ